MLDLCRVRVRSFKNCEHGEAAGVVVEKVRVSFPSTAAITGVGQGGGREPPTENHSRWTALTMVRGRVCPSHPLDGDHLSRAQADADDSTERMRVKSEGV